MAGSEQKKCIDNDLQGKMDIQEPSESHFAMVLLVDTSLSMSGDPINSLNKAINYFKEVMISYKIFLERIDVCIIEFNDTARVVQEFTPISRLEPVKLTAVGPTSMGAGIDLAIDKVKERVKMYKHYGTPYYRPWIFMITDGFHMDDITDARERMITETQKMDVEFWTLCVPGYDRTTITSLPQRYKELKGGGEDEYRHVFYWLSYTILDDIFGTIDYEPIELPALPLDITEDEDWW